MEIVSDLHLHSKYSRAVSPQMTIPEMARWAKIKGIGLLGTGDFTHPKWQEEIKANLVEKDGIFRLRGEKGKKGASFILTGEISSIYKQSGKTRKVHSLILLPSFEAVEKICAKLREKKCNLNSDGRPIIGLSVKELLSIVLEADSQSILIPAHIWTPWFSMFGDKSGFDSIEECFEDLSKYIYAIETGLSSDPEMNWAVSNLDNRNVVSFSDAHSGSKLGREATVLEVEKLTYDCVTKALKSPKELRLNENEIKYTIEFYPEEGKYHYSGHRKCNVIYSPEELLSKGTTCPVCGKKLTGGVIERVEKLGETKRFGNIGKEETDSLGVKWIKWNKEKETVKERAPFVRLVPLIEIIAESLNTGISSKKADLEYKRLIESMGTELEILLREEPEEIEKFAGKKIVEGIMKVRSGDIFINPGYDGEFGVVKVWRDEKDGVNVGKVKEQGSLF